MAPGKQTNKQELAGKLAEYRGALSIPDTRKILSQSRHLLQVAGRLPTSMQARPARTLMITAGVSCLLVLLLKPRRRRLRDRPIDPGRTMPRQLMAFSLSVTQPLLRVWLTEQARRRMRK